MVREKKGGTLFSGVPARFSVLSFSPFVFPSPQPDSRKVRRLLPRVD